MTWYTKAQADHDDEMRRNAAEARPMIDPTRCAHTNAAGFRCTLDADALHAHDDTIATRTYTSSTCASCGRTARDGRHLADDSPICPTISDLDRLQAAVDRAREAYAAFQDAWQTTGSILRDLDEWQYQRVDAYPGWHGTRDVGAGQDMLGWIDEIDRYIESTHP